MEAPQHIRAQHPPTHTHTHAHTHTHQYVHPNTHTHAHTRTHKNEYVYITGHMDPPQYIRARTKNSCKLAYRNVV